ncbi:MAG: DUF4297 domain-containing protein [Anaerolineaceae bacterium]|nr:DUF4297 domain-containing protein [Anaerolineaceae bacterium]
MSDFSPYSARASMRGYDYQKRYALYLLLSKTHPDTSVAIEILDDVDYVEGSETTTVQLKHKTGNANLTDKSEDLWKTISLWSNLLKSNSVDGNGTLLLATTEGLPTNRESLVVLLSVPPTNRDLEKIVSRLNTTAGSIKNKKIVDYAKAFQELSDANKLILANSILVQTDQPSIQQIEQDIKNTLQVRDEILASVYEDLLGWWITRVDYHLDATSTDRITRRELRYRIDEISDKYAPDNLPINFAYSDLPEDYDVKQFNFKRQLDAIQPHERRIQQAILDYYRATEERSKWINTDLINYPELDKYEKLLVEAWQLRKAQLEDELPTWQDSEDEMQRFGREILRWVEDSNIPIRSRVTAIHITRGSFHMLANRDEPRVWWHPQFLERLTTILGIETVPTSDSLWDKRPLEIANLFNPAFCSVLLRDAIGSYDSDTGMPYILVPLILPVILHGRTRSLLPSSIATKFHVWITRNPTSRIGFADIVNELETITKEALAFGLKQKIISIDDSGNVKKVKRKQVIRFVEESPVSIHDAESIRKSAEFVGRWYARVGDPDSIWTWWGIKKR